MTKGVSFSEPPCKDGFVRFTTVPFKPLLIMLKLLSILYLGLILSDNSDNFSCRRNAQLTFLQKPQLKITGITGITGLLESLESLLEIINIGQSFKGTFVHRALSS